MGRSVVSVESPSTPCLFPAQIYREFVALSSGKKFRIVLMAKSNMASVIARCKPQHASAVKAKVGALMRGIDVVVSTPQRLQHMVAQHPDIPFFQNLEFFVLDEADKLFELGFVEQIDSVIAHIDKHILSSKRVSPFLAMPRDAMVVS